MVSNNREYRNMAILAPIETRDGEPEQMIVNGYASTFDEPYLLYEGSGWKLYEVIDRSAFNSTDMSDVIMQYDHAGRVFARTRNNTLEIEPDEKGLFIKADLGGTDIGRELYGEIRGGYTDRMSFGFTVDGESEERSETPEGVDIYTRRITSVKKLYDVSAVSFPANDGTSIEADATTRSISDLVDGAIERIQAERLAEEETELGRQRLAIRARTLSGGCK